MNSLTERLLERVFRIGRYRAWWVFVIALAVTGGGVYYALDIPLRSSAIDLLPVNDPLIEEYKENEQYAAQSDYVGLLLTLTGDVPDTAEARTTKLLAAAEAIKQSLDADPDGEFREVAYLQEVSPDIPDQYLQLFELDEAQLARIEDSVELARSSIGAGGEDNEIPEGETLGRVYEALTDQFNAALGGAASALGDAAQAGDLGEQLAQVEALNVGVIDAIDGLGAIPSVTGAVEALSDIFTPELREGTRDPVPFLSRDAMQLVMTAQPQLPSETGVAYSELVSEKIEQAIARVDVETLGITVGVTGTYTFNASTNAVINNDMLRTTIVSSIGVFVIFLIAFGSVFYSIIAVVPLLVSVVLTMCWAKFAVGGFNLVTTFLPALVLGLGIDYAIHLISRYAEERSRGRSFNRALHQTILSKGKASLTAAATTSLVFLGLLLAKSRALFEMGAITSVGVMLAFGVTLILLPTLITLSHHLFRFRARKRETIANYTAYTTGFVRFVTGRGRAIFVIVLVLTFFVAFQAARTSFVFSSTDLVPRVESQDVMEEILANFDLSPAGLGSTFTFYASTGEELRDIVARLEEHELVEEVDSAAAGIPVDLTQQQQVLNNLDIQAYVSQIDALRRSIEERAATLTHIRTLLTQFGLLQYGASMSGRVEIAESSHGVIEQLLEIQDRLTTLDMASTTGSLALLSNALNALDANLEQIRDLPPAEELLRDILLAYPEGLRSRYLTPEGEFVIQARVSQRIFDADNLAEFDRFAASFSDDYFGMPLVVKQLEKYMKRDYLLSTAIALGLIVLILWRSFRGWVRALLAAAPLVLGYIWMLGGMRLMSIDFNFLSITISPLLIGIGVDNGIHILHRTLEERACQPEGAIERGVGATAVAVIVTSLTTMLVFASLVVARTPGLRLLGASALLGIGFALVFSLLFLPAAMRVEGGKRV